jgi:hypothetical protein
MKTRVRVKRSELIKVVEGRVRKAENAHKRAVAAYPAKVDAWNVSTVERLEKALANAKRGKLPEDRYGNARLAFEDKPQRPSEGRELCNLRRILATLKMGSEDSLLLSQDDADSYFGPCRV